MRKRADMQIHAYISTISVNFRFSSWNICKYLGAPKTWKPWYSDGIGW